MIKERLWKEMVSLTPEFRHLLGPDQTFWIQTPTGTKLDLLGPDLCLESGRRFHCERSAGVASRS